MPPPTARQKAGETDIFKLEGTDICTLGLTRTFVLSLYRKATVPDGWYHEVVSLELVLLPFQSAKDFRKALASADVLLAVLERTAAKYSVSRPTSLPIMAAGKPIRAAIPADDLAARTLTRLPPG
jgi:hypothetical protein